MRALILIFSIFFFSSTSAQDLTEYGFAMTTNNECENYDEAITIFKELNTYIETNTPYSTFMRCGMNLQGQLGCLVMTENYQTYEENMSWAETDETWSRLIRQAWKVCGIDDFGFGSEAISFE